MAKRLIAACLLAVVFALSVTVVSAAEEKIVVVLDAGHGAHDGGTDAGIRTEKEYNLLIAQYLYEELSADDRFTVVMTRDDDTYLKFLPRAMIAMENNADVLISLHCNSSTASYVNGNMAYCSVVDRFDAGELAGWLLDAISEAVPISRGDVEYIEDTGDSLGVYYWNDELQWDMPGAWQLGEKSDYYSINTWASKFGIPSIIVEHGYLSNPNEAAVIDKDENLRSIAKAEADAIIEYYTGHTHTFGAVEADFPSNCTLVGTQSARCTVCGVKKGTQSLPQNTDGHYWRRTASAAATCTADGYAEYVCQIAYNLNDKGYECAVHTYSETYAASGHNYTVIEDTQAGHGYDGRFVQRCENCGDELTEVRQGELHSYAVTESTAPTCEEDGRNVYTCSVCEDSYEEVLSAVGHSFEQTEAVEASATEDGYVKYKCMTCGAEKLEEDPACEHQFVRSEILPTCTDNGIVSDECSLCGYEKEEEVPAAGHDYVKQMDVAASCSADGFYKGKCSLCGDVVTETREALPHDFEVTEESVREIHKTCKVCGAEEVEERQHRSLSEMLKNPLVIAVLVLIVVQLGAAAFIVLRQRGRHRAEEERRSFYYADDVEDDDVYNDDIYNNEEIIEDGETEPDEADEPEEAEEMPEPEETSAK